MKHGRLLFLFLILGCTNAFSQTIIFNPTLITGGTPANIAETVQVIVENTGNTTVNLTQITGVKTTFPAIDWLGVEPTSLSVPAHTSDRTFFVIMNKDGVFGGAGVNYRLEGYVFAKTNLAAPEDSLVLPIIEYDIGGGSGGTLKVDTLETPCVRLAVSETGEVGSLGSGTVNLDYLGQSIDCSPTAKVYLYSDGPMLIRRNSSTDYTFQSGLYQIEQFATSQSFTVLDPGSADTFSTPYYSAFTTGVLATTDTTIGVRRTYYAPKNDTHGHGPCDGMIVKTEIFPLRGSISNLTLAEVTDWDVPSDTDLVNVGGIDTTIHAIYQRGIETDGSGCQSNAARFAAQVFLAWHSAATPCVNSRSFHGGYVELTDSLLHYDTADQSIEGKFYWDNTAPSGLRNINPSAQRDLYSVLTFRQNFSLAAADTLVFFTALTTLEKGSIYDLEDNANELYVWYVAHLQSEFCPPCPACCVDHTGNVDCDPSNSVDIADLTALIDNLFVTFTPLCCVESANCDGGSAGQIDIADFTALIDNLFISFTPLPICCQQ